MSVHIYNTLTRKKELFQPLVAGKVGMYVCGMTVYDFCHLGHARVMVAFDVIARYLRHRGYDVNYIRNITDIDDKIIQRANENGETIESLTERFIVEMHKDSDALGIERPSAEPKATAHIDDIVRLVQTLIDKGFAYAADNGDVYYSVRKFDGYGKLSGKVLDDLTAGARVDVDEHKQDPLDFVLWKAAKVDEPHWHSPWGIGRPGWHIECSAMSTCCLGDTFDIHGGGPDLKFPHHENEIAQSEAATGKHYANNWMHAGAVRVDGEKMSKSLGNFFTIREILEKYPAEVVRFFLLSSHYRSSINYSEDGLIEAKKWLDRFYGALDQVDRAFNNCLADAPVLTIENDFERRFYEFMDDDFNTPSAIRVLFDITRVIYKTQGAEQTYYADLLIRLGSVLGCLQSDPKMFLQSDVKENTIWIDEMIEKRALAKKSKNFEVADEIREKLREKGILLKDSIDGTTWTKM